MSKFSELPFNLMDTIHHPKPTPEDEKRLSEALDKIFPHNPKLEHNQMTALSPKEQLDQAVEASAVAAQQLIKEDGWAILRELYRTTAAALNATSIVIIPALERREEILSKLSDPEGFSKDLQNCMSDIEQMISALEALSILHVNKTGTPDLADLDQIGKLTLGYANLQHKVETAVQPLLMGLIAKMQEAGVDTVSFVK
ncbi:hypothetical protein [Pseudomonas phage PA1C]|nr:hypothetical protein [Pseudomonas phage PA1C]